MPREAMTIDLGGLPDDAETLKEIVVGLAGTVREKDETIQEKDQTIQRLKYLLANLRRAHFGRRSEKVVDPDQQLLFEQQIQDAVADADAEGKRTAKAPAAEDEKKGHGRKPLPDSLPRKKVEHDLPKESLVCKDCNGRLERIGEEKSEQLEYIPASLLVKAHIRAKYACKNEACQGDGTVVTAPVPEKPIEKGLPGPGLLAQVVVSKYSDHLPLYRQEAIFERHGVEIRRSTMCDWVAAVAEALKSVCEAMKAEVLRSRKVHTDDTIVPVLDETRRECRKGRLWVYVGDDEHPFDVFEYTGNRSRDGPVAFLAPYEGYLQADAYGGYDGIYQKGKVIEVACWAHARRKFIEAEESDSARARLAIAYIRRLYEVESRGRGLSPEERKALRQRESRPILEEFRTWLVEQSALLLPKSPLATAVGYALGQWEALKRYLDDGILEIDNNAAERALRCVAIGRKNWLFAGSDAGGERAAVLYSVISTCKRHGIDPFEYLRDVLDRLPAHPPERIAELLPTAWKAARNGDARPK